MSIQPKSNSDQTIEPLKKWVVNDVLIGGVKLVACSAIAMSAAGVAVLAGKAIFGAYHLVLSPDVWGDFAFLPFAFAGAVTGAVIFVVTAVKAVWNGFDNKNQSSESKETKKQLIFKALKFTAAGLGSTAGVLAVATGISMVAVIALGPIALLFGWAGIAVVIPSAIAIGSYIGLQGLDKTAKVFFQNAKQAFDQISVSNASLLSDKNL